MPTKPKPFYPPDEYLSMERVAEAKSEYYKGEITAFAGVSINHYRISSNVIAELNLVLKIKNCPVLGSDVCTAGFEPLRPTFLRLFAAWHVCF